MKIQVSIGVDTSVIQKEMKLTMKSSCGTTGGVSREVVEMTMEEVEELAGKEKE